jgi:hypothetical protein
MPRPCTLAHIINFGAAKERRHRGGSSHKRNGGGGGGTGPASNHSPRGSDHAARSSRGAARPPRRRGGPAPCPAPASPPPARARRSAAPACTQTANERPAHQLPAPRSCRRGRSGDGTHHQHLLLCWDVAHQLRQSGLGVLTQLRTGALPAQPLDAAATAAAAAAAAAAAPG